MSKKSRILVVDDNEEFCQNLKDIVELRGYEVLTAHSGLQALNLVTRIGFDLVLMDVRMPVMDGIETFKRVKRIAPQLPVILVTACAIEQLVKEALRAGAFGFLKKPMDFERLFGAIENALFEGALVLVVDDDRDFCANLEGMLKETGYRVIIAYDRRVALEKTWESEFDAILLDVKPPVSDGLAACQAVLDVRPNVVVVVVADYGQEISESARQMIKDTAHICIERPVDMGELVLLLERIMEEKTMGVLARPE